MNNNSTRAILDMDVHQLVNLTTEVKETVADKAFVINDKSFSITDLWNIQKSRKTQNLSKRPVLSRRNTIL